MFPNFGGKSHVQSLERTCQITDVKSTIIPKLVQENGYNKQGANPKIRLFHLGRELVEGKPLQEYCSKIGNEAELVIHVFMSQENKAQNIVPVENIEKKKVVVEENVCNCNMF